MVILRKIIIVSRIRCLVLTYGKYLIQFSLPFSLFCLPICFHPLMEDLESSVLKQWIHMHSLSEWKFHSIL